MELETVKYVFLETFHVPFPRIIVAIGASIYDEPPCVELCVDHAFDCGGEWLARPVKFAALGDEPFKLGRQYVSRSSAKSHSLGREKVRSI